MGMGTRPTLTLKDAAAIEKNARGVSAVSPVSSEAKQLMFGNQNWSSTVYGTTPEYFYIKNYEVESGRGFVPEDIKNSAKVSVIGSTVATELFGDLDPIGKIMRVGNIPFKVIGTLKSKGSMGPMDQDDLIFIPITTAQKKVFGTDFPGTVSLIVVKGSDPENVTTAEQDIEEILTARHHIGKNQVKDFEIRNSAEFQEKMKSTVQTFAILLASIASVSLLVGGIGIMNIMLVSVTERTKEIGILRAIGASKREVCSMFNAETIIIGLISGVFGVALTYILCIPINAVIHSLTGINNLSAFLPIPAAIVLILVSVALTLLSGLIPSRSAAKKDPVVALRTE